MKEAYLNANILENVSSKCHALVTAVKRAGDFVHECGGGENTCVIDEREREGERERERERVNIKISWYIAQIGEKEYTYFSHPHPNKYSYHPLTPYSQAAPKPSTYPQLVNFHYPK
jgi:hypothetical protein